MDLSTRAGKCCRRSDKQGNVIMENLTILDLVRKENGSGMDGWRQAGVEEYQEHT